MADRIKHILRSPSTFVLLAIVAVIALSAFRARGAQSGQMIPRDQRTAMAGIGVTTIDGAAWRLEEHHGEVVVVNYFATWCPPCRAETPDFVTLANAYKDKGVKFVGLSLDRGDVDVVKQFVSRYSIPYPVAIIAEDTTLTRGITSIPVTRLVDRQGRLARAYVGAVSEETLRADTQKLLAEPD